MSGFICPVCKEPLSDCGTSYKCENNHCFDKSKFGYVNLLRSNQSSAKRHGDDRMMVRARRDFLDREYYGFLKDKLCEICGKVLPEESLILDAGCGECYYSSAIEKALNESGKTAEVFGVDISKDALEFASKRKSGVTTAVASVFNMPFADENFDAVLNVFSPEAFGEFVRLLKKDGVLIRVIPLERHLLELKELIYETAYLNEVAEKQIDGFELVEETELEEKIEINSNEDLNNLFKMTPYYYKTGRDDQLKLQSADSLKLTAQFCIRVYRKED